MVGSPIPRVPLWVWVACLRGALPAQGCHFSPAMSVAQVWLRVVEGWLLSKFHLLRTVQEERGKEVQGFEKA